MCVLFFGVYLQHHGSKMRELRKALRGLAQRLGLSLANMP